MNKIWKAQWKRKHASCDFCPWHRGENWKFSSQDNRSWKKYRKTQYK